MTPEHLQTIQQVLPRVLVSGPAADVARELNAIQAALDAVAAELDGCESKQDEPSPPAED